MYLFVSPRVQEEVYSDTCVLLLGFFMITEFLQAFHSSNQECKLRGIYKLRGIQVEMTMELLTALLILCNWLFVSPRIQDQVYYYTCILLPGFFMIFQFL